MDLQTLTDHFAIPGVLSFSENEHGLVRAAITTPACTAELYLQGAHLTQWQPAGHEPVLFLSGRSSFEPGKPIRGGIPVIFPWFGPRTANECSASTNGPSHGFARTQVWTLAFAAVAGEDLHLTLTLGPGDESRSYGFDHFQVACNIRLGAELRIELSVANQGVAPMCIEEAFHTYLNVGDARQMKIIGLTDTDYIDKIDNGERKHQKESPLVLTGPTDRPYLNTQNPVTVDDVVHERRITVDKSNSHSTVVWNPWDTLSARLADMDPEGWRSMVCVETANVADNLVKLAPGAHHTMQAHLFVEKLAS